MLLLNYTDDALTTLAADLTAVGLSATLTDGSLFPTAAGTDDYFFCTIRRASDGAKETVKCTGTSGDVVTISDRAQGAGEVALAFVAGDSISVRVGKNLFDAMRDEEDYHDTLSTANIEALVGIAGQMVIRSYRTAAGDSPPMVFEWDASDLSTEVAADTLQGMYIAPTSDATGASGAWVGRLARPGRVQITQWGFGESTSAANNILAMQEANAYLIANNGGVVEFPGGAFPGTMSSTVEWIEGPGRIEWVGIGYEATTFYPDSLPGGGAYLLKIQTNGGVCSPIFKRVGCMANPRGSQEAFNGIHIAHSNHLRIEDCQSLWVGGIAWWIERPYNAEIDIKTYACGGTSASEPAVLISGSSSTQNSANDVLLVGTSEQDIWGWHVENTVNIRDGSQFKLHGGPNTNKIGHFHCVSGTVSIQATLGVLNINGIEISDNTSQAGSEIVNTNAFAGYQATRLKITDLHIMRNWVPQADPTLRPVPADQQAVINIDIEATTSAVSVSGLVTEFNATVGTTGNECVPFRLSGAGASNVDLSEVLYDWTPTDGRVVDERVTKIYPILGREGPVLLPDIDNPIYDSAGAAPVGTVAGMTAGGNATYSQQEFTKLYRRMRDAALGWLELSHLKPYVVQLPGTISATSFIGVICPDTVYGTPAATPAENSTKAKIVRLQACTFGIPDLAWDGSNNWQLEIYHTATLTQTLDLAMQDTTASSGDGLPDFVGGFTHPDGTGRVFDFTQGLDYSTYGPIQAVSFKLVKNGTPPDGGPGAGTLTDFAITAHVETSIYEEP